MMRHLASPYFAAIDLGSNSFHMIIARVNQGTLEIVDRVKEMVQIARGMQNGVIAPAAQERALECLQRFAERIRDIPASQVRVVGTKSLRTARNAYPFLRRAESALGQPIAIISGFEEARLVYCGLAHSVASDDKRRLVVDIGGGSTEIIIGQQTDPTLLESLSMGCVVFTEDYELDDVSPAGMRRAYLAACKELEGIRTRYRKCGWDIAYGTSGTIRSIADLLAGVDGGALIREASLQALYRDTLESAGANLGEFPALRRSVLPAGIAILKALFDQLRLETIHAADVTLKEGLLYDTIGRLTNVDTRHTAVSKLQKQYAVDIRHADRVADCAMSFWERIKSPPLPGISRSKILNWAARLHEVGLGISHSSHHNHSFYVLKHSDVAGFGRYEQFILACLVRAHRKKLSEKRFEGMQEDEIRAILPLILCLRLAVVLLRRREPLEHVPELTGVNDRFELIFRSNWLENNPLTAAGLNDETCHFANMGITLTITETDPGVGNGPAPDSSAEQVDLPKHNA